MDEDILAELDRQLTNVNLDKYWIRKVGDFELWLTTIDYTQSNKVKKVLEGDFALEEAQRVTIASAIVGVNGNDLRPLRAAGKTIKVKGKDGKSNEFVDLSELMYRKIAHWDAEFIDVVFRVYSDLMETHRKDLVKAIVFDNAKNPEEELNELEEKVQALRERLGKPPLVEAQRIDLEEPDLQHEDAGPSGPTDEELEAFANAANVEEKTGQESASFDGAEEDFDPFAHVKAMRAASQPAPEVQSSAQSAPPPVPVPVPSAPSAIDEALAHRRASPPVSGTAPSMVRPPVKAHVAQPSVPSEVLEKGATRIVVDPPKVNPNPAVQSKNPRFRNAGLPR